LLGFNPNQENNVQMPPTKLYFTFFFLFFNHGRQGLASSIVRSQVLTSAHVTCKHYMYGVIRPRKYGFSRAHVASSLLRSILQGSLPSRRRRSASARPPGDNASACMGGSVRAVLSCILRIS
jgi:hypothetical protein